MDDEDFIATPTLNRDARKAAAAASGRPGTFKVLGHRPHDRRHGEGDELVVETVQPGGGFTCSGDEAEFCRKDPDKFQELT